MKKFIEQPLKYIKLLAEWILLGAVLGVSGGLLGSIFHITIDKVTELRTDHPWLIFLLPAGGVLIVLMYRLFRKKGALCTDRILKAADSDETVPLVTLPLIFVSSAISHLFGASVGREGAALQLGGSLGYNLGALLRLKPSHKHIAVMAGMSAVFAALFGTPVTAAFFAIEVIAVGVMHYGAIVPCITAAVCAVRVAELFGIEPVSFVLNMPEGNSISAVAAVAVLSSLCALVSIVFCRAIHGAEHLADKYFKNIYVRALCGGVVIILLSFVFKGYNGAGMDVISRAMNGEANPEAFVLKILFTAISVAAGFKGGEIVPAFFIGSTFGCVAGPLLGLDPSFSAAIGFVALFCGVVNCPAASFILAVEVFGGGSPLLFAVAVAMSFMLSGKYGLYKVQKMPCSKLTDYFEDK